MFIYFPELLYTSAKYFIQASFNYKYNKDYISNILKEKFASDEAYKKIFNNFRDDKIPMPNIEFSHCIILLTEYNRIDPRIVSYYNRIENKVKICKNYISDDEQLFGLIKKELTHALLLSKEYNKANTLNDYAIISIKSCQSYYTSSAKELSNEIKRELIKRCALNEFKYKYDREIRNSIDEIDLENSSLKLNKLVSTLINQNLKLII